MRDAVPFRALPFRYRGNPPASAAGNWTESSDERFFFRELLALRIDGFVLGFVGGREIFIGRLRRPVIEGEITAGLAEITLQVGAEVIRVRGKQLNPCAGGAIGLLETGLAAGANEELPNDQEMMGMWR